MIPKRLYFLLVLFTGTAAYAQRFDAPLIAVKTNLLGAPAGNLNAAVEFVIRHQRTWDDNMTSINLPVSYNPFTFSDNKKIRHLAFQPEVRIKVPNKLGISFIGLNAHYALYNVGGLDLPYNVAPSLKERRYEGHLFGAGATAGQYFKLAGSFGFEATIGVGYAYMESEVYRCQTCGTKVGDETKNYLGLTKAALSLVYTVKL